MTGLPLLTSSGETRAKLFSVLLIRAYATSSRGIPTSGQAKVVRCYNCQGEDIWLGEALQPKRPRNAAWILGQIKAQTIIPHNVAFQTEDLDTYDSDCDDISTAQAKLGLVREMKKVDLLEQNLSKQIKEKESLLQTFNVFKNEAKEKENKYQENKIDLEKKIKELDNIVYKVGQSTQTAQRIKPTLYDGCVISEKHDAMPVVDDEETLILEEESRSKMSKKAKDPEAIKQNISHKPIDYEKLNRLTEDFGKRFSPQQELSAEQAFWFRIVNPSIEPSYTPPVIVDVPSEILRCVW
ncbi:hypothetical protein Tco_0607687 [Tanacetum coccineum]